MYFPFHPLEGSHSSKWISESFVGLMIPCTAQCAGATTGAPPPRPPVTGPSGTAVAEVMVACSSARLASPWHVCCANNGAADTPRKTRPANERIKFSLTQNRFLAVQDLNIQ